MRPWPRLLICIRNVTDVTSTCPTRRRSRRLCFSTIGNSGLFILCINNTLDWKQATCACVGISYWRSFALLSSFFVLRLKTWNYPAGNPKLWRRDCHRQIPCKTMWTISQRRAWKIMVRFEILDLIYILNNID